MQDNIPEIHFQVSSQAIVSWNHLLREGVDIEVQAGRSVQDLLLRELNIPWDTVRDLIKTIFLNQKPVDDLQTTVPHQAQLTLSGAMPGFLGACMRINSPYASMRESISNSQTGQTNNDISGSKAIVRLKLFNVLVPELGPLVLQKGILLTRQRFADHLKNLSNDFWKSCHQIKFNQNSFPPDISAILESLESCEYLHVFVEIL